jgi:hypothetical protein
VEEHMRIIIRIFLRIELLFFIRHSHVCIWHLKRFEDCSPSGGYYECPACFNARRKIANCWFGLLVSNRRYFFSQIDEQSQIKVPVNSPGSNTQAHPNPELEQCQSEVMGLVENATIGVQQV